MPTRGSFDNSHIYADNGIYTVTVTVTDDDSGSDTKTFAVTVKNVNPTLTPPPNRTTLFPYTTLFRSIGTFTDPGFDNPLNPNGASVETFKYVVNWGDGTTANTGDSTPDTK